MLLASFFSREVQYFPCIFPFCNSLIHKEYLFQTLIGAADGGTAVGDGTYLNLYIGMGSRGLQTAVGRKRGIDLIADGIGISVGVGAADGGVGDVEALAVGGDGDARNLGNLQGRCRRGEANAVKVEQAGGAFALWNLIIK